MVIKPVDPAILRELAKAVPLPGVMWSAVFWFSSFFKSYTVMFEGAEAARGKDTHLFLTHKEAGGSYDHMPINNGKQEQKGTYHVHNGGVFYIEWLNVKMPIKEWEEAYIALYNTKYRTGYLTCNQAHKLLHAADNEEYST